MASKPGTLSRPTRRSALQTPSSTDRTNSSTALSTGSNNPGHPSGGSSRDPKMKISKSKSVKSRADEVVRLKHRLKEFWPNGDWYPSKHKPQNPDCPRILSGMCNLSPRWVKLGRNVNDLWEENGLMEQSINLTGKKRFGQVSMLRAKELLGVVERDMAQKKEARDFEPPLKRERATTTSESQLTSSNTPAIDAPSDMPEHNTNVAAESSSIFDSSLEICNFTGVVILPPRDPSTRESPPASSPKPTSHEHSSSPNFGTPSQPRGLEMSTVDVLRQGGMLWSNHIWECVQSFTIPLGWKVFDPGFPFTNENHVGNRDRIITSPRHLVFFCHSGNHWSLCHVDTQSNEICHYNSSEGIVMPLNSLQTWLKANKIESGMNITEKVRRN
jgi:hypothetical protein